MYNNVGVKEIDFKGNQTSWHLNNSELLAFRTVSCLALFFCFSVFSCPALFLFYVIIVIGYLGFFLMREQKEGCRFRWVGICGGSERSWGRRNSYKNVLYEQKNQFSIKKYNIHGAKNWPVPAIFLSPNVQYSTWWRDHHLLPVTGIHLPNDRTAADVIATDVLKG